MVIFLAVVMGFGIAFFSFLQTEESSFFGSTLHTVLTEYNIAYGDSVSYFNSYENTLGLFFVVLFATISHLFLLRFLVTKMIVSDLFR